MTILLGYTSTYSWWNAFNFFYKYWANSHLKCKKCATLIHFFERSFHFTTPLTLTFIYQPQGWSSRQSLMNVLGKHIVTVREIKLIQSPSCSVTNLELLLFFYFSCCCSKPQMSYCTLYTSVELIQTTTYLS